MIDNSYRVAKALNKLCSRREAERWILAGRVTVNGKIISSPALNITNDDIVKVDGTIVNPEVQTRMWLYYKPIGVITTNKDNQGRRTVFDTLPSYLPRVITIGRLDINSEGLLLLTNDGKLARSMELPSNDLKREYSCRIYGKLTGSMIHELGNGITIDNIEYKGIEVSFDQNNQSRNTWIKVALREGKNREIRKVFEYFDIQVNRLIRLSYDTFKLGNLMPSEVKEVPESQLQKLVSKLNP